MKSLANSLKGLSNLVEKTEDIFNINNPSDILVGVEVGDGQVIKSKSGWVWIGPKSHKDNVTINEYDLEKIPYNNIIIECDTVYLYVYENLKNKIISCQNNVLISFSDNSLLKDTYINCRFAEIIPSKNYSLVDSGITSQESILFESSSDDKVFPILKNSEIKSYKDNIIIDCDYSLEELFNHKFDPVRFFNIPKDLTHFNACSLIDKKSYRIFSKKNRDYKIFIKGSHIKLKNDWIVFADFNQSF